MGCSNHMCGKREMFFDLEETVRLDVKFENNTKVPVMENDNFHQV